MAEFQWLILQKVGDKAYAIVGDIITYTLTAKNISTIMLNNLNMYDLLVGELEFIPGTVEIEGISSVQDSILAGVNIGSLAPGLERTISFQAKVLSAGQGEIANEATARFNNQLLGTSIEETEVTSNLYTTTIYNAQIEVVKTADKTQVLLEDTLTYNVSITNTGNITAYSVLFKDLLSLQAKLIPGTFKIGKKVVNGVELDKGIVVGNIAQGSTLIITYQVNILGTNCRGMLTNSAVVEFQYRLPDGTEGKIISRGEQSMVETEITMTTFKQISIESYLAIPDVKPNIEAINTVAGTIDITTCYVITTPTSMSSEGQILTGYKLVVRGSLKLVIEYTALDTEQSVHSAHYSRPFSTFIILPQNYVVGSKLDATSMIEDIYYKEIDIRNFFSNTTALINVKILTC